MNMRREYLVLKTFFKKYAIHPAIDPSAAQTLLVMKKEIESHLDEVHGDARKILGTYVKALGVVARAGTLHHGMVTKKLAQGDND